MLRQGLLLLLSVMLLGWGETTTASNPVYGEAEAGRVLAQSRGVAEQAARNGVADAGEQRQIAAQLNAIASIEALAERGLARVSAQRMRQLQLAAEQLEAIPVAVTADSRAPSALTTISGTVTAQAGGAPMQNVSVRAFEFSLGSPVSGAGIVGSMDTNASGQYTLTLPPGNYVVRAVPASNTLPASPSGYLTRVYNDLVCNNGFDCPIYFGTVIALTSGTPVSGIDLQLSVSAAISGTILRASDSSPISGGSVIALRIDGNTALGATSAADGSFTIKNLPPGTYRVWAGTNTPAGLMSEALGNVSCAQDDCPWVPSTFITVTAGSTATGANFTLDPAASLSGTVRDDAAAVVANAELTLYSDDRYTVQYANADASGNYSFPAVRAGTYRLLAGPSTSDPNPPFGQISTTHGQVAFPNIRCPGAVCAPLTAGIPISVTVGLPQVLAQITLPVGSSISGLVRDASTSVPVAGALISISNSSIGYVGSGITDAAGNYTVRGLPAGVYYVSADARSANYVLTHNGNVICPILNCEDFGTPVTLTASGPGSTATANIDLQRGGTITGSITDALTGAPASRQRVRLELYGNSSTAYAQAAFQTCTAPTTALPAACSYTATGLAPGTYKGAFISSSVLGWIDTAFGGAPCPRGGCDLTPLPPLFATTGSTLATINGTLPRGALVRGNLSDAAGGGLLDCRAYDPAGSGFACGGVGFNNTLDNYAGFAQPDRAGNYYSRTGFTAGTTVYASTFLLRNNFSFGQGYVDQAYNGISCPYGSCGIATGTGITIPASDVAGINFALNQGGSIAGQVTSSAGGAAIAGVVVKVYNPAGRLAGVARSKLGGDYRVYGLAPGSYFVTTTNTLGFLDEVYNNLVCDPFCNPVGGSAVVVSGSATTSAINFALDLSATIQGTLRVGATPTANVPVELYGAIGNLLRSTSSNGSGGYTFSGLPAGRYFVRSRDTGGRADALFNGLACVGNACQVRLGTPIDLAPPTTTLFTADLTLTAAATVSGTITRADNGNPLSGVQLQLLTPSGAVALTTTSGGSGAFAFNGLAGGNYHLVTRGTPGFIDVAWPSAPCPAACSGLNGSSIPVVAGTTVGGRNFALQGGGSISGTLRSGPAAPIVGATVQVYNNSGVPVGQITSNASGNYQVDTLPSGNFFVRTQQSLGFVDQVFNALPCSGYCDVLSGTPVPVSSGIGTGLVDFTLAGGSSISGRVSSAASGSGIALARVVAFDSGGFIAGQAQANASGDYSIAGLRPGTYRLRSANLSGYINQVHAGLACTPTPCTLAAGTPIVLGAAPISGINFSLTPGGTISGTAGDSFNNPLPTGTALLLDATGAEVASVAISNGVFEFNGVAIGTYYVLIRNTSGLVDQLYANVPCPGGACNVAALGTPIVVTATRMERSIQAGPANINLRLPVGQTIAGTVRDASNSAPLAGVTVSFFNSAGAVVGQAVTDGLGQYQSEGSLPSGSYFAATTNGVQRGAGSGYVNALYNAQNCLLACTFTSGTA
ncbi:MAG TPA: carboxypeptidase regulatory-like domain-containing protein, partial [Xanthomonadales bacterium]|nr:carboxypeptidase regulatory-like domain-containing protein [Xanthomonadales bacterium]